MSKQLYNIINDSEGSDFIKTSIHGVLYKPTRYKYDDYDKNKEMQLLEFLKKNFNDYQALIDTAGIIIDKNPLQVIEYLYNIDKTRTYLYVDSLGIRTIYEPNKFNNKFNNKLYNNKLYNNLFIYYDNKNCVGIDFIQPYTMKGLVTVSNTNNLTEISQGIFRLRNINIGHTIDFYIDDKITEKDLYKLLELNDKSYKKNCRELMILQYIKYYDRMLSKYNIKNYIEPIYYETVPIVNEKPQKVYSPWDVSDSESELSDDLPPNTLTYNEFINSIIDKLNNSNGKKIFKNIIMPSNITLNTIATNLVVTQNIVTIKQETNYANTFTLDLHFNDDTFNNITDYINYIKDTDLFSFNKINSTELLTIGNFIIKISPFLLLYYKMNLELYFIITKKNNKLYIYVITFFEYLLLQVSNDNINSINIYDKYGYLIHKTFDIEIPNYIVLLLFKSKFTITETINSIVALYSITNNTNNIIEFCKNIINTDIRIIPYDNVTFNNIENELSVEFWSKLLNINISKSNYNAYTQFKNIIQQIDKPIINPIIKPIIKPINKSLNTSGKDKIDVSVYNKYLKYKNKYLNLQKTIL